MRTEGSQPMLSIAFRANISNTKTQTGNILGVRGILNISNACILDTI